MHPVTIRKKKLNYAFLTRDLISFLQTRISPIDNIIFMKQIKIEFRKVNICEASFWIVLRFCYV